MNNKKKITKMPTQKYWYGSMIEESVHDIAVKIGKKRVTTTTYVDDTECFKKTKVKIKINR